MTEHMDEYMSQHHKTNIKPLTLWHDNEVLTITKYSYIYDNYEVDGKQIRTPKLIFKLSCNEIKQLSRYFQDIHTVIFWKALKTFKMKGKQKQRAKLAFIKEHNSSFSRLNAVKNKPRPVPFQQSKHITVNGRLMKLLKFAYVEHSHRQQYDYDITLTVSPL